MLTRRPFPVLAALLGTLLSGAPAWAQPAPPPTVKDLSPASPWTYVMGMGVVVLAVLLLAGLVLGYLVKAREFRANLRRGGSK